MISGKELDVMVARKVLRAIVIYEPEKKEHFMFDLKTKQQIPVPDFSTSIKETYKIINYLQGFGWVARMSVLPDKDSAQAVFTKSDGKKYKYCIADTLPQAICLAAIEAVEKRNIVG